MLLNFVQTAKFLDPSKFSKFTQRDSAGKEFLVPHRKRFWLSSAHAVNATLGGRDKGGVSQVWYGIEADFRKKKPDYDLTITNLVPPVGSQSLGSIVSLLNEMGSRMALSGTGDADMGFDYRSLCYVCGYVAAATSCGIDLDMGTKASVAPLSPTRSLQLGVAPIVASSLYRGGDELATLLHLFRLAGAESVSVTDQSVPAQGGCLTGEALGVYALKVFANVMGEAAVLTAAAAHLEAKFSGEIAVMRVLGHSWEGGCMRRVLRTRSYPAPCGMIRSRLVSIVGLSTTEVLARRELFRYQVASVLEGAGRIARSDPSRVEGLPTIFTKGSGKRPSDLVGFEDDCYALLKNWRKLAIEEHSLVVDNVVDTSSLRKYFHDDREDDHFLHEKVVPFFYVEPGPVSTSLSSSVTMLGCQAKAVSIPLMDGAQGYKTKAYQEFEGRAFPGSVAKFVFKGGYRARDNGINYLMSGRYSKGNGLAQFNASRAPSLGVFLDELAMSDSSVKNLADKRWHTYHNPLPNPGENFTNYAFCVDYTYSGLPNEASIDDFVNVKVRSMFGPLVVGDAPTAPSKYHRDVPDELVDLVAQTNGLFTFLSEAANVVIMSSLVESEVTSALPAPSLPEASDTTGTNSLPPEPIQVEEVEAAATPPQPEQPNDVDPSTASVRPSTENASAATS